MRPTVVLKLMYGTAFALGGARCAECVVTREVVAGIVTVLERRRLNLGKAFDTIEFNRENGIGNPPNPRLLESDDSPAPRLCVVCIEFSVF